IDGLHPTSDTSATATTQIRDLTMVCR
ncbi:MAG: hypothetical protein QOH29_1573, partial [Actinomycetota bacterium]|nr:hypothetical protein [Actinomycetota bacterium]